MEVQKRLPRITILFLFLKEIVTMKPQKKLALILAALMLAANFAACAKKDSGSSDTPDKKGSEVVDVVDNKTKPSEDKKDSNADETNDDKKADDTKPTDNADDSKPSDSTDIKKPDETKTDDQKSDDKKQDDTNKSSGKDTPQPHPEPQPEPQPTPETTVNAASIEKAIADAIGTDNYLCNTESDLNWYKNAFGLDLSKIKSYVSKQNAISAVNLDTVIVLEVEDGYADTAVGILNAAYAQTVSYIRQYAFGVGKVMNARIYKEGNYVMYILAGASYDGEDFDEENKLAMGEYAKIDAALAKLFGSTPVNLAVIPEDDGNSGGLIFDDDAMDEDIPMLGEN